jgi:hypothetical protein
VVQAIVAAEVVIDGVVMLRIFGAFVSLLVGCGWIVNEELATGLVWAPEMAMAFTVAEALRLNGAA